MSWIPKGWLALRARLAGEEANGLKVFDLGANSILEELAKEVGGDRIWFGRDRATDHLLIFRENGEKNTTLYEWHNI